MVDAESSQFVEAEYALERAVKCPHCAEEVDTLFVLRLLRTKVNFTSTLPRRGYVLVCPRCQRIMSAELTWFG